MSGRAGRALWVVALLCLAIAAAEGAARLGARHLGKARLLTLDRVTGWRTLERLDVTMRNAAGEAWDVRTDAVGNRWQPQPKVVERRLIVLGDSFAFGEGVPLADRFDATLAAAMPHLAIINVGVMGFGLDQSFAAALKLSVDAGLKLGSPGDIVLVLLYRNDFRDVLLARNAGRPKSVLRRSKGEWQWHAPAIGWRDLAADSLYIATPLRPPGETLAKPEAALEAMPVVAELMSRIRRSVPATVPIVLAHFGRHLEGIPPEATGGSFCGQADLCVDLDEAVPIDPRHYLPDGHWSAPGHKAAGRRLLDALMPLIVKR